MYFRGTVLNTDFSAAGDCLIGVQDIVTALRHIEALLTLVLLCMYIQIVRLNLLHCCQSLAHQDEVKPRNLISPSDWS